MGKRIACQCRRCGFSPQAGKMLWRRTWHPTPVFLPGESHGRRSLVGYSPRGHKESDTPERLHFTHFTYHSLFWWFSCSSHTRLFETPRTAACQASLSFTISWSLFKFISIELVMPSNHLTLCHPFSSHLQSSPALGSFQMSQLFASGGQSIGASASASVLPMNIQD